jgi:hypothetical protein
MDTSTAKCPRCGYVRVARDGSLSADCPKCEIPESEVPVVPANASTQRPRYATPAWVTSLHDLGIMRTVTLLSFAVAILFGLYQCTHQAGSGSEQRKAEIARMEPCGISLRER